MKATFTVGNERDVRWDFELDKSGVRMATAGGGVFVSWPANYSKNNGWIVGAARYIHIAAKIQHAVNAGASLAEVLEDMCIVPEQMCEPIGD